MPPLMFAARGNPACSRINDASAERPPERQTATIGRSRGSSPRRARSSPSGSDGRPGCVPARRSTRRARARRRPARRRGARPATRGSTSRTPRERVPRRRPRRPTRGAAASRPGARNAGSPARATSICFGCGRPRLSMKPTKSASLCSPPSRGLKRALLADAARRAAAVVVGRIDDARRRQREQLLVHRAIQPVRVALLEVGASGAADQQRNRP